MRKRTTNKHLPPNVHLKSGTYYYVYYATDGKRKWHKIGNTLSEAMDNWTKLVEPAQCMVTMGNIFDRYMVDVAPLKAKTTYQTNKVEIKNLYKVFGHMTPDAIEPKHIYQYLDVRGKVAPVKVNREKALLSHVFSQAIRWGIVTDNPCKHVSRLPETRRDRYVSDEEFHNIKQAAPDHYKNILDFAYFTGLRETDILELELSNLLDEGVFVIPSKTKKRVKQKILIEWTPDLKEVVNRARCHAEKVGSHYLFPNLSGKKYTVSGFQTNWQKIIKKAINENLIQERFQFRDLRRKTASDVQNQSGRENARQLLGHSDQKMTESYISGVQKVKPVK